MKKILVFAGSNSKESINKKLSMFAATKLSAVDINLLDLNDFELPIYGIDYETSYGIPENAAHFLNEIKSSDGIIISLAEHNGAYATVFKNILDWMSRVDGKLWNNIPMLLMATSPGGRGGSSVLEIAKNRFPYMGGNIVAEFSLPSFHKNLNGNEIIDEELSNKFKQAITMFESTIK